MIHIGRVLDRERGIALSKEEAIDLHKKLGDYLQIWLRTRAAQESGSIASLQLCISPCFSSFVCNSHYQNEIDFI